MKYVVVLVFCLFMGALGISLGLGAAVPSINLVAQPILCPDGEMSAEQSRRQVGSTFKRRHAGKSTLEASWTCEDPPGTLSDVGTLEITAISGTFWGLVLFLPLALLMAISSKGRAAMQRQQQMQHAQAMQHPQQPPRPF